MTNAFSLLVLLLTAVAMPAAAGQDSKYRAPRAEDGRPDFQGVWNFNTGVPLQRPASVADRTVITRDEAGKRRAAVRNAFAMIAKFAPVEAVGIELFDNTLYVEDLRTSLITYPMSGRLPALVQGVKRTPNPEDFFALFSDPKGPNPAAFAPLLAAFTGGRKNSYTDFSLSERCLFGAPVPLVPQLDDNFVQIIQSRDHVVLVSDFDRRVIALNASPASGDALRRWSGTSTGRWEGETLVVESRNFDGRGPSFAGAGNSRDKVVTERFTRTSSGVLEYSARVVDPKTFQDRVELSFPMALVDAKIYEGACHEGNYSLPLALSGARAEDARK